MDTPGLVLPEPLGAQAFLSWVAGLGPGSGTKALPLCVAAVSRLESRSIVPPRFLQEQHLLGDSALLPVNTPK